jgi:DNA-binding NarL/FixJ family response regulator
MDAFPAAIFLVDHNLHLLRSNAAARQRLDVNGDSFLRLLTQGAGGSAEDLRRQAKEAIATGTRTTLLLKPSSPDALICSILPLRRGKEALALAAITRLVAGSSDVVFHLRRLYRLSNAEAEIAAATATGMDVVQLAEARGVSVHTLRAQTASIKAKMSLSRMSEVAVTVGRIEAAVTWL